MIPAPRQASSKDEHATHAWLFTTHFPSPAADRIEAASFRWRALSSAAAPA